MQFSPKPVLPIFWVVRCGVSFFRRPVLRSQKVSQFSISKANDCLDIMDIDFASDTFSINGDAESPRARNVSESRLGKAVSNVMRRAGKHQLGSRRPEDEASINIYIRLDPRLVLSS